MQHISDHCVFSVEPEQKHDLLNFRLIGEEEYFQRISAVTLKQPSASAPNRKHNIKTFTEKKPINKKTTQVEKDRQLILSAMKRKIQFSKKTGKPLALCDHQGIPLKGQKSTTTKYLEKRYQHAQPPVFL
jgi:hypothetical protein